MKKPTPTAHTYRVKCSQAGGFWRGFIYVDNKLLEKTAEFWTSQNCVDWLNKRIDFHNKTKGLAIPYHK